MSDYSLRLLGALVLFNTIGCAAAQEIARLYAAQAPAGSAYVRVVNPGSQALRVEFGGKQENIDGVKRKASDYRIINAAAPMALKADGKPLEPVKLQAGSFNTLIVDGGKTRLVADATDARNDLKAELRFYNLAAGCKASLALVTGAAVFKDIAYQGDARRHINPVKASLSATCDGAASSQPFDLPALKPGDHISFFLTGDAKNPGLSGQVDATEAYSGAR